MKQARSEVQDEISAYRQQCDDECQRQEEEARAAASITTKFHLNTLGSPPGYRAPLGTPMASREKEMGRGCPPPRSISGV